MLNQRQKKYFAIVAFSVILILGLLLRFYQYFMERSLWHDEAHLALNFIYYGYEGLTKPLAHWQVAPILFLFVVEASTQLFGFGEIALRLPIFIISVFTFPLFYYLCKEAFKSHIAALYSFLIFACNISFIYFASELKPYILGSCFFIIIPWILTSSHLYIVRNRYALFAIVGSLAVLFTNVSIVIIVCAILYMLYNNSKVLSADKNRQLIINFSKKSSILIGIVIAVFLINYFMFINNHPYAEGMKKEWEYTFWPANPFSEEFSRFIGWRLNDTFYFLISYSKQYYFPYIFLILFIIGIISVFVKGQRELIFFAFLPIVIQILLSIFKIYPFFGRFTISILPATLILFTVGLFTVSIILNKITYNVVGSIFAVLCLVLMIKDSLQAFPKWDIRIKPSLTYINEHYPNTPLLVTTPATMYEFYHRTGFASNGNFENLAWNLDENTFYTQDVVASKTENYIILRSNHGGDNSEKFIKSLNEKGLIVNEFINNNFAVTEVKPLLHNQENE